LTRTVPAAPRDPVRRAGPPGGPAGQARSAGRPRPEAPTPGRRNWRAPAFRPTRTSLARPRVPISKAAPGRAGSETQAHSRPGGAGRRGRSRGPPGAGSLGRGSETGGPRQGDPVFRPRPKRNPPGRPSHHLVPGHRIITRPPTTSKDGPGPRRCPLDGEVRVCRTPLLREPGARRIFPGRAQRAYSVTAGAP